MPFLFDDSWYHWFGEAGAYQWSYGDFACYAGGGILVPVGWDWLQLGALAGGLFLMDGDDSIFTPAISPRITIDTRWASCSTMFLYAGDESAFGFTVMFPLCP